MLVLAGSLVAVGISLVIVATAAGVEIMAYWNHLRFRDIPGPHLLARSSSGLYVQVMLSPSVVAVPSRRSRPSAVHAYVSQSQISYLATAGPQSCYPRVRGGSLDGKEIVHETELSEVFGYSKR